jgi:hypothetical protein
VRQEDIDNWFQYHTPTPARLSKYFDLRNSAKAFAEQFDKSVPDCADKTAAMRHLRETVMAMNLAIACNPEEKPAPTTSKEKVLARFPEAYVTSSPKFPAMVSLYTNVGDYYLNATDEQTAWDHMAEMIEKANA